MQFLTTGEAANYLRIKERKLYELVSENAIPCTKATGKWLFAKHELDRWLLERMTRPNGMAPAEPLPIVGGSHDPLLEWSLRESGCGLATLPEGSAAGLQRFIDGKLVAAAIHLHAFDDDSDENLAVMQNERNLQDAVLVGFARREQGMVVAAGNPLGLKSIRDLSAERVRVAVRPAGAGAQLLLELLLMRARASMSPSSISLRRPVRPVRTSRRRCARGASIAVSPRAASQIPQDWDLFRWSGSGSIWSSGSANISGQPCRPFCRSSDRRSCSGMPTISAATTSARPEKSATRRDQSTTSMPAGPAFACPITRAAG